MVTIKSTKSFKIHSSITEISCDINKTLNLLFYTKSEMIFLSIKQKETRAIVSVVDTKLLFFKKTVATTMQILCHMIPEKHGNI